MYYAMLHALPVAKRRIAFNSNLGKSYSGNPKYIYQYMYEQGCCDGYDVVWFYESVPFDVPGRVRQVRYGSLRYLYYMATANIWVFDCRQPEFVRKRPGVTYIQTWHGTPLKKLALDLDDVFMANEDSLKEYKDKFAKNVETWDFLISQNDYSSDIFRRAFGFSGKMLEYGYPRNDVLVRKNKPEYIRALKEKLGLPMDKKIILYAPTWRDDDYRGQGRYRYNSNLSFDKMKAEIGHDYAIILKYHYLVVEEEENGVQSDKNDASPQDAGQEEKFLHVFDKSYDIAELYLASDLLVTDYSSVMFDYCLLRRPILFYAYDYEAYRDELRGFYLDFEREAPGPIAKDTDELIHHVVHYDGAAYQEKYDAFVEKYNVWDDGKAAERVMALIARA